MATGEGKKTEEVKAAAQAEDAAWLSQDEAHKALPRAVQEASPTVDRETATAIEQRHNVIVDVDSEMYTNDDPSHLNGYGATGWQPIPQVWIDEAKTPRHN